MPKQEKWLLEVEELVSQAVSAEAGQEVWKRFEVAMGALGEVERSLLQAYFQGQTPTQMSLQFQIPEREISPIISNAKQQLTQALRSAFQVRQ